MPFRTRAFTNTKYLVLYIRINETFAKYDQAPFNLAARCF